MPFGDQFIFCSLNYSQILTRGAQTFACHCTPDGFSLRIGMSGVSLKEVCFGRSANNWLISATNAAALTIYPSDCSHSVNTRHTQLLWQTHTKINRISKFNVQISQTEKGDKRTRKGSLGARLPWEPVPSQQRTVFRSRGGWFSKNQKALLKTLSCTIQKW